MYNRTLALITFSSGVIAPATIQSQNNTEHPNILFIIADDASYHHFSANGCRWTNTPAFDRIAEEGLLFNQCYTSNAKSAPSRACILTGKHFFQMGAATNHNPYFPSDLNVFTESLTSNGYKVGYTGKGWAPGKVEKKEGKERSLTGKQYNKHKTQPPTTGINRVDYAMNFIDFLDETPENQPWFFWFGCFEPHRPYEYGSGAKLSGKNTDTIPKIPLFWPDNDTVRNDMLDYGFEIEYFDNQISKFLAELEKRNMLENTLIIVTADNGMPFPRCKGNNYEYSHHMPLAIMWKDKIIKPGREINDIVNFMDFAPTILEVAGVKQDKILEQLSGRSLTEYFNGKSESKSKQRKYTLIGRERHDYGRPGNQGYPIRGIIKDNFLYICNLKPELLPGGNPETGYSDCDGSPTKTLILNMKRSEANSQYYKMNFDYRPEEELYDLSSDKECIINLSENTKYKELKKELRDLLLYELKKNEDPRIMGNGDVFDKYPYCEPIGVNFWEKVMNKEIIRPWEKTGWISPTDYSNYSE